MRKTKKIKHSAYWYAKHYGWTQSDAVTYTGRYFDYLKIGLGGIDVRGTGYMEANPIEVCICVAKDIVCLAKKGIDELRDPLVRERIKCRVQRDLRRFRRPRYYAAEVKRRHMLADARRGVRRRSTTAAMPTPEEVLDAWNRRRESKSAMIRLGGMLHDLECYVDNRLRFDSAGNIVGRNRGVRGWIEANLPELAPRYKTLMGYKAMAIKLRQAAGIKDPTPTSELLIPAAPQPISTSDASFMKTESAFSEALRTSSGEGNFHVGGGDKNYCGTNGGAEVVREILGDGRNTFVSILEILNHHLSPEKVFAIHPLERKGLAGKNKRQNTLRRRNA